MQRYFITFLLLAWACCSFAASPDRKKDQDEVPTPTEGVAYALPRTGIQADIQVKCQKFIPGPYHQFAERFLGISNVPGAAKTEWSIIGVQFDTFSEPDPARVYKAMGQFGAMLSLTENGIISGLNTEVMEDETIVTTSELFPNAEGFNAHFPDMTLNDYFKEVNDSVNGTLIEDKPIEERAYEIAHLITKLRKRRFHIMSAKYETLPPDGKSYEVLVEELARVEKNYVELFTGKTITTERSYSFSFVPTSTGKGQVVFRFSPEKGILPSTDLSGSPVLMDVQSVKALALAQQKQAQSANPAAGTSGLFYCMPGVANIRLISGVQVIAQARVSLAQIGTVAPLPENMVQGTYSIQFHPKTGAIKSINRFRP
ncbi:DUF4831 family protein [Prolixibacteraceae bacterium JC049]|nr:DUF4831 family protein [Prolixibacteraceae bacterium JC049]